MLYSRLYPVLKTQVLYQYQYRYLTFKYVPVVGLVPRISDKLEATFSSDFHIFIGTTKFEIQVNKLNNVENRLSAFSFFQLSVGISHS